MDKKSLSEADICLKFITPALVAGGWDVNEQVFQEVTLKAGRVVVRGHRSARDKRTIRRADYMLCRRPGVPIAIIEAKDNSHALGAGMDQAILLHGKSRKCKESVFLDDPASPTSTNTQEREANNWSGDWLIPPEYKWDLTQLKGRPAVVEFARQLSIHPGIVVGRLQHDGIIPPSWLNDLKDSFRITEVPEAV